MSKFIVAYYWSDQIKEDEIGGSCNIHDTREMHIEFEYDNLKKIDHLRNVGIDGKLALKWTLNKSYIDRIQQAENGVKLRVLLNPLMTLRVPQKGYSLSAERLSAS
jgi:hypothetical protein